MKKRLAVVIVALFVAASIIGCGGGTSTASSSAVKVNAPDGVDERTVNLAVELVQAGESFLNGEVGKEKSIDVVDDIGERLDTVGNSIKDEYAGIFNDFVGTYAFLMPDVIARGDTDTVQEYVDTIKEQLGME